MRLRLLILSACMCTEVSAGGINVDDDVLDGQQLYQQCVGCHSPAYHRTGPKHCNLIGRVSGSALGFNYSSAMQGANIIWTAKTLDLFLEAPLTMIPGTSMGFFGIASRSDRKKIIAYLESLTLDSPNCE